MGLKVNGTPGECPGFHGGTGYVDKAEKKVRMKGQAGATRRVL